MIITEKITTAIKKLHPLEILFGVSLLSLINFFYFPGDYLFLSLRYNPYLIVILFFSMFYGKALGIITLIFSLLGAVLLFFISNYSHTGAGLLSIFQKLLETCLEENNRKSLVQFIFISFILSIIFGEIRDTLGTIIRKLKEHKDLLIKKITKLEAELSSIALVNEEYQDRILGQQSSLISLYSTMVNLNSLDLESIYPNILNAIVKFSNAGKCSLWKYRHDENILELLSESGWEKSDIEKMKKIPDSDSITGWVARNNSLFTVKMLKKNQYLQKLDVKQNIITVPINIENRVWGILNIEEMPFVKYNLYSEQLIVMIADLAAPIISNAIRFNEITMMGETDPVTKLRSINEMFIMLREEFSQSISSNLHLSFIIVEINNSTEILQSFTEKEALGLIRDISNIVSYISKGKALVFQYKEKFQFSIIMPNMDHDGAAMFCLSMIEAHGKNMYKINDKMVHPEIIIGYSSLRQNHKAETDLILLAENLLQMQKI